MLSFDKISIEKLDTTNCRNETVHMFRISIDTSLIRNFCQAAFLFLQNLSFWHFLYVC